MLSHLNRHFGRAAGDAYKLCNEGSHRPIGDYKQLVNDCTDLLKRLARSA